MRRTGHKTVHAQHQPTDIHRMKPVHILFGNDGLQNLFLIQVRGQRQLYKNTVDIRIDVQLPYQLQKTLFARILIQTDVSREYPHLFTIPFFRRYIGNTCRVFSNQNYCQSRSDTLPYKIFHLNGEFITKIPCNQFSIYYACFSGFHINLRIL